jgi:hypothetical protein
MHFYRCSLPYCRIFLISLLRWVYFGWDPSYSQIIIPHPLKLQNKSFDAIKGNLLAVGHEIDRNPSYDGHKQAQQPNLDPILSQFLSGLVHIPDLFLPDLVLLLM